MTAAADRRERTDRRLRLRRTAKLYALPAIGLLAMLLIGELFRIDMRDVAAAIWGGLSALLVKLGVDIGQYSASRWIANGLFGLVAGSVATGLLNRLGVIDRLFPDPPTFVFADLEAERTRTLLEVELGTPPPLTGREAELARLEALLDRHGKDRFAVVQATGPTGIGKTRLSVEWLARAEAAGWDIGVIDPERLDRVRGWKARRPTALVLDEADSPKFRQVSAGTSPIEALLVDLLRGASKAHPVRLVLAGQTAVWGAGQAPETLRPYLAPGDLVLAPLDQDAMAVLAGKLASEQGSDAELIQRESAGRPRHAIVLARAPEGTGTYRDALNEWANRAVPALTNEQDEVDPAFAVGLIAAALVGPVPTAALAAALPEFAVGPLLRFFPGETRHGLEAELPRLEPADWAQVLALRLLDRLPPRLREDVALPLLLEHPEALEASLGAIWRDYPHWVPTHRDYPAPGSWQADLAARLMALQTAFDTRWPERVEAMHQQAKDDALAYAVTVPSVPAGPTGLFELDVDDFARSEQPETLERAKLSLIALADTRPFDRTMRLSEAKVAGMAIFRITGAASTGHPDSIESLEFWGRRLDALFEIASFAGDRDMRQSEADATVNAIRALAAILRAGNPASLGHIDSWLKRFDYLRTDPNLASDPELRTSEINTVVNATAVVGMALEDGFSVDLALIESWGLRIKRSLEGLSADDESLDQRDSLARALYNIVRAYSSAVQFRRSNAWEPLQHWLGLFDFVIPAGIAAAPGCVLRREEVRAIQEALVAFSVLGRFDLIEDCRQRLDRLLAQPGTGEDRDIAAAEAKATNNAISVYGTAANSGRKSAFAALEQWGTRFDALYRRSDTFLRDPAIRSAEAIAAGNAIYDYGLAGANGHLDAFDAMERWALRFDAMFACDPGLANDQAIRFELLQSISNRIGVYSKAHGSGLVDATAKVAELAARLDQSLQRLPQLAQDPSIRMLEARACHAIVVHQVLADEAALAAWRGRLARLIQLFGLRPDFANLAARANLSLSEQEARGWPYGRVAWGNDGSVQTLLEPAARVVDPADAPSAGTGENGLAGDAPAGVVTSFSQNMTAIGRNEPCPCGSGKRYKHCHGTVAG